MLNTPQLGDVDAKARQDKTLVESDTNASMEALEFLAPLFIVITLPEESSNKQLKNVSQDEISFRENLTAQIEMLVVSLKSVGCGLARNSCSINRGYPWQLERSN